MLSPEGKAARRLCTLRWRRPSRKGGWSIPAFSISHRSVNYAPVLERHSFKVTYATLFDRPTEQKPGHGVKDWVRMFVTKPFEGMEECLEEEILTEAEEALRSRLQRPSGSSTMSA